MQRGRQAARPAHSAAAAPPAESRACYAGLCGCRCRYACCHSCCCSHCCCQRHPGRASKLQVHSVCGSRVSGGCMGGIRPAARQAERRDNPAASVKQPGLCAVPVLSHPPVGTDASGAEQCERRKVTMANGPAAMARGAHKVALRDVLQWSERKSSLSQKLPGWCATGRVVLWRCGPSGSGSGGSWWRRRLAQQLRRGRSIAVSHLPAELAPPLLQALEGLRTAERHSASCALGAGAGANGVQEELRRCQRSVLARRSTISLLARRRAGPSPLLPPPSMSELLSPTVRTSSALAAHVD